ncbi:MAG: hypothetical protein ACXWR1_08330 [Bdellovibrionota bacterium]
MAASALLVVSGAVSLSSEPAPSSQPPSLLAARGWAALDQVGCEGLLPGHYYEVGNEETTAEIFAFEEGRFFASRLPLPEAPYACRPINEPHFVEEIL